MTYNHGEAGLQLDEENAWVGTDDEDETSQTPSSSSDGCDDNGIDLENNSSDTWSKYCIVRENLYSWICINIGVVILDIYL